jgi:hypothetical protein
LPFPLPWPLPLLPGAAGGPWGFGAFAFVGLGFFAGLALTGLWAGAGLA